ncbi:hypothetical protein B0H16DRAFT_1569613 [Mycena metata]|uniref:Uncharacterized protein n=1 Tax=Mycena metata TaxID=1033252 RepID=A0AAD7IC64_9AGAR|nr:hypothetical protein B0H16DRAFT_1569613 [Mycena metata]
MTSLREQRILEVRSTKLPFADSSNRTKLHAHLRSASASSPRKSPPTCTLSLASVSTASGISIHSTPSSVHVPFPSDNDDTAGCCGDVPRPMVVRRRPRARTSHVETPRPAQPLRAVWRNPKQTIPARSAAALSKRVAVSMTPDLRAAALVEHSLAQHIQEHGNSGEQSEFARQDALLLERLRTTLALHGRRTRPSSPTGITIAPPTICAPSVLSTASDDLLGGTVSGVASPMRTPPPALFIPARARSGSRGSIGEGNATLNMPALAASLILRRHEGGRRTASPGTFALARLERRRTPSPLSGHVQVLSN